MALARALLIAAVALSGPSGCLLPILASELPTRANRTEDVREAADDYIHALRWGLLDAAAQAVTEERRGAFIEHFTGYTRPLKFTSAEIERVDLGRSRMTADVWVSFEFYQPPSLQERRVFEHQVWRYKPSRRSWEVEPDLAVFPAPVAAGAAPPPVAGAALPSDAVVPAVPAQPSATLGPPAPVGPRD
jgi:hypothetical protein